MSLKKEFQSPVLTLDKDVCLKNIERMALKAKKHNLLFRPHFKTHQSIKVGEWFKLFNVHSITVSSVRMAEFFAANGWNDITIAISLNILEIENINRLAHSIKLNILVENKEAIHAINKKITSNLGVFIKIDTGFNRSGILSGKIGLIDSMLELLKENKNLQFKGFLTHSGHTYQAKSPYDIHSIHFDAILKMKSLKQRYKTKYPNLIISIGDTPSCSICNNFDQIDEIRPGNFVFYDLMQLKLGTCDFDDIALKLICPVLSVHKSRNEVIIYGGAIHLSKDYVINIDGKSMYGRISVFNNEEKILLDEKNYVSKLTQELSILKIAPKNLQYFIPGTLVEIIPVHSCLTANLNGYYLTNENESIPMMPRF